jgi:tetratricopeptide (TPR) repeat protein
MILMRTVGNRWLLRIVRSLAGVVLVCLLAACASTVPSAALDGGNPIPADVVLDYSPLSPDGPPAELEVSMLGVTPEMVEFLDRHVDREAGQKVRLVQLLGSVVGQNFMLDYDTTTLTAQDAFATRHGNCLSFTNMFVAMAREVGLPAEFQEVDIPPDWSMSGETFLLSQHINAVVEIRNAPKRVVDFNAYTFNAYNEGEIIGDARARAHYFNNIGVEFMLDGEVESAHANLRQALREDRLFAPAWVNLGILHRREGQPAYAEAAWLEALRLDRDNLLAMSNLASLYEEAGRSDLSERYLAKVRTHRKKNPYYRFQAAREAFDEGDYDAAIEHLEYAIRKREDEDRFYHLLSLAWLMKGDGDAAQHWMRQAEQVAQRSKDRQRYHHKLQLLMGEVDPTLESVTDPSQIGRPSKASLDALDPD